MEHKQYLPVTQRILSPEAEFPSPSSPELDFKMLTRVSKDNLYETPLSAWAVVVPILQRE